MNETIGQNLRFPFLIDLNLHFNPFGAVVN